MDQLFEDLKRATSMSEREVVVSRALQSGAAQDELREMLDYLETFENSRNAEAENRHSGNWTSFISAMIHRYWL